jgi:hypothetical protein
MEPANRDAREKRRVQRFGCLGPIEFRIQGWYVKRGRILNLCLDGCLIEPQTDSDCIVGDHLEIRFEVNRTSFRAQCVVRRIQASGSLGVEILRLSDRGRRQLLELVGELAVLSLPGPAPKK